MWGVFLLLFRADFVAARVRSVQNFSERPLWAAARLAGVIGWLKTAASVL